MAMAAGMPKLEDIPAEMLEAVDVVVQECSETYMPYVRVRFPSECNAFGSL